MRSRSTRVAWGLLAAFGAIFVAANALSAANGDFRTQPLLETVPLWLAFTAFMVVGALIVAHRPGNPIGRIFSAIALLAAGGGLAETYARYAYETRPGSLPGAIVATWFAWSSWYPTVALAVVFTPLLFPTGRLLSPRWRPVAWLAGAVTAAIVALAVLQPTFVLESGRTVDNPIGVAAAENPDESAVGAALTFLLMLSVVAAFTSLIVRFRRSRGEERQQLKWFTYAAALVPFVALGDVLPEAIGNLLFAALTAFLPIAAGISILRYRLYEIDRLINRTLVYGLLTVLLAGTYAGLALVGGQLSGGVADGTPSWAVAVATLAVAALFQPARRRVQAVVDRRFNRRRYDAARTVEAFSARLRDQIDLDTLSAELLAGVEQTVEPTTVSLWLRPATRP
ncbi:MAG TPA: hypothetical protein VG499_01915 [Actinomycetota bacterium]|nr:hypothetical protein [Actinomycetota bacterium]